VRGESLKNMAYRPSPFPSPYGRGDARTAGSIKRPEIS
jgi:hypothetical protein